MIEPRHRQLIAVVGGSGAGKGWFVDRLCRVLGDDACHLQLDDFYHDLAHLPLRERARQNFDVPEAIDWERAGRVLRACRRGEATAIPRYDFATHSRAVDRAAWLPRPIVFVDGLWLLHPPEIRALFTLKLFLDTPPALRRSRRLERDVMERGYTREAIEHQLRTAVTPMHERYVEPQKQWADLILTQPFQASQVRELSERFGTLLTNDATVSCWEHERVHAALSGLLANHECCT